MMFKNFLVFILLLSFSTLFSAPSKIIHKLDDSFKLQVYESSSKKEGKTILIIGGIHGDEESSYLAPELIKDMKPKKGKIIFIPRSNIKAIKKNLRFVGSDINRLFNKKIIKNTYENNLVKNLKNYIKKSDVVLNLHEGKGFASKNSKNFGQAVVIDEEEFNNCNINLKKISDEIVFNLNKKINNKKHFFATKNTYTETKNNFSMKGSATYYSLKKFCKPAFGLEVSKDIKEERLRVKYMIKLINEFINYYNKS
jgi:Ni,Fe-hydrogenase maturation factor